VHFEQLKCLLDEVTKVISLALTVVDLVSHVQVLGLEQVHDWQDLSVIWHKGFSDGIGAANECLQDLKSDCDNFWVSSVQSSLYRDDQLRNDWKYLGTSLIEHVKDSLGGEESVWINFFKNAFEENWQVMMVIQLLNVYFPINSILWSVFNSYWQISSIVEKSEFTNWNSSGVLSTSSGSMRCWGCLWFVQTG